MSIESKEFYDLTQEYRNSRWSNFKSPATAYKALIDHIDAKIKEARREERKRCLNVIDDAIAEREFEPEECYGMQLACGVIRSLPEEE